MPKNKKQRINRQFVSKDLDGSSNIYFSNITQDAIVRFQGAPSLEDKNKIFTEEISPVFNKLIENIIFTYKFSNLDLVQNLKHECLINLYEALEKFNPDKISKSGKPTKAFSYFTVTARNFFLKKIKDLKKTNEFKTEYSETCEDDLVASDIEENVEKNEFFLLLQDKMREWVEKSEKVNEKKVLNSIIYLFDRLDKDDIIFNKKAFYIYMRALTNGMNSKQIISQIEKIKKKYLLFRKKYENGDV